MKKICSKCHNEKPTIEFSNYKRSKDGLHAYCRQCNKECQIKSRAKIEIKERDRLRSAEYRKNNPEKAKDSDRKYRENNRPKTRKATKNWNLKNPAAGAIAASKRRARKRHATPAWLTREHHEQIKELHEIARMFMLYTGTEYHVDHIVPLAGNGVCGLHVPWNITVLEGIENQRKKNLHWPDMPKAKTKQQEQQAA